MVIKALTDSIVFQKAIELLKESNLPSQDLTFDKIHLVGCYDEKESLLGIGGLEFYNSYALMRSIAVAPNHRGISIGKQIVNNLIEIAKTKSVDEIYLLTETAHDYFTRIGFKDIKREDVPFEIKKSSEFDSVCPVSAACMVYKLFNQE